MKFKCETHNITLSIEGNKRIFHCLWTYIPNCILFSMKEPSEGKYGDCNVVREE